MKIVADKIEQKKKVTNGAKSGGKLEQLFKSATAEEQVKPSAPVPAPAPTSNEQNDTGKNLLRWILLLLIFSLRRLFDCCVGGPSYLNL